MMSRTLFSLFSVVCIAVPTLADKNATIEPTIARLGSVIASESFDQPLAKPMQAVKGEWKTIDGVLVGKELAADEHAAVLNYQQKNRNSVVRFSFQLNDQTKGFNFSLNHRGGHLFRVIVSPAKLAISLDKDKKDPASKPMVLANAKGDFQQGKWYTLQVEMVGDRVVAQTDHGIRVKASHAKLDTDKPNYRFVMRGESLSIDDLQIWEAQ
jgi:hypothetical protein